MKNARGKLESPMPAAMPCKTPVNCRGETCRNFGKHKAKYACIVDADESMRIRLEGAPHRYHEDHIPANGINSLNHYNLVHEFIPMPHALKILDTKGSTRKNWGKMRNYRHGIWQKVRNKKEVIDDSKGIREEKFMSRHRWTLCHLKNAEVEPKHHKNTQDESCFRGDMVKDDSGSHAEFNETRIISVPK